MMSNTTSLQSPSRSPNPTVGFAVTNRQYRSILAHPIGIPLAAYVNDVSDIPEQPDYVRNALHDFQGDDFDVVFANATLAWRNGSEPELTAQLLKHIHSAGEQQGPLREILESSETEKGIVGNGVKGRLDLLFHDPDTGSTGDSKKSIVAIVEFGFENKFWWTKQDQILSYVSMLCRNEDHRYKFDQPMLLSVITLNKSTYNSDAHTTETPVDQIHFEARFGVFLCVPKGDGGTDFRITLLWRVKTTNLKETSCHFGKLLNAVQLCWHLRKYCQTHEDKINYEYLGPNCCRIGDIVSSYVGVNVENFVARTLQLIQNPLSIYQMCFESFTDPMIVVFVLQNDDRTCTWNEMYLTMILLQLPKLC